MLKSLRVFVSPFFLSHYYLSRDIRLALSEYKFDGSILDNGCGQKPYQDYFKDADHYCGIDFENYSTNKDFHGSKPDYYYEPDYTSSLRLPFNNEQFNHAVAFQVLEHHPNPLSMLSEMKRVIKPGGLIMLTSPFLGGLHELPHDYQRLTIYGLRKLLDDLDLKVLIIKEQGSLFSTIALLLNEHLTSFGGNSKLRFVVSVIVYPPFLLFSYLAFVLDKVVKSKKINFNYILVAEKKA